MSMTPLQAECLAYIQFLLASELQPLSALYKPSGVMAHIEIESSWQPDVGDHVDSFGSAGLMQVLPSTAMQMGVTGSMLDPANSILAGMRYLENCRVILAHYRQRGGGVLSIEDVVAAYNEGPGNVMRGRQDPHYVEVWTGAQKRWAFVDALPMDPKALGALKHLADLPAMEVSQVAAHDHPGDAVAQLAEVEALEGKTPPDPATPPAQQSASAVAGGLVSRETLAQVREDLGHNQAPPAETQQDAPAVAVAAPAPEDAQVTQAAPAGAPSGIEANAVEQHPADSDAADDGEGPNGGDQPEQADEAEALNREEAEHLEGTPATSAEGVAQHEGSDNPSLNGA